MGGEIAVASCQAGGAGEDRRVGDAGGTWREGKRRDAFKGLDFCPCFLLALKFRRLLVATFLSGSCHSMTRGAETRAENIHL